ncbi:hypothetical protein GGR88_000474 [Sphingomonas jejuensis]|uniref:Copper chaperone PCu(A)C n=1 Tax=Sphingomonas jejuensis TaxID=904715 RepID=A0ABX0XIE4_9SPHN|nr:hypothetical protein [Sphingomonas jejuensis]
MKILAALALPLAVLAGCSQPELHAEGGWVQLPAVPGNPAAAYFTLKGGVEDNALIAVTAPRALRAELHQSMQQGGMAAMEPVRRVPVPARGETVLAPGGTHVMLFGLDRSIASGQGVELLLTFEAGPAIRYTLPARTAAEGAPER